MAHPDQLAGFIAAVARKPWRWGECDCLMVLADWGVLRTGVDAVAGWRSSYSTRREAFAIIESAGGIERLLERCILPFGWRRNYSSGRGDIGLVRVLALDAGETFVPTPVGAICLEPKLWAVKTMTGGIAAGDFPVVAGWSYHG